MKNLLLAVQFLTILPVKIKHLNQKHLAQAIIYFPVVGLLLGAMLSLINNSLLFLNINPFTLNIILVVTLIIFTGGLHLDGLADTTDALLSGKNKEEMLNIMRDPHIGTMGILSIVSIILLKIAFLCAISASLKITSLLLMCALSRWSMVFTIFLFPYARREGKAKIFTEGINLRIFIFTTIIAIVLAITAWQLKGIALLAITALFTYIIGSLIKNKINGITGDSLGAINELTETIILITVCILQGR